MACLVEKLPNGRWTIKFDGGKLNDEHYDQLINWAKGHDHEVKEAPKLLMDVAASFLTADNIISQHAAKSGKKEKPSLPIFEVWNEWYSILKGKYHTVLKPQVLPNEEGKHIKMLLMEYGKAITLEIFKLAVLDWSVLCARHPKLSPVPTLRSVVYNRSELAMGVSSKGLTTDKQRVSEYGKVTGGAYDDWKIKKEEKKDSNNAFDF
jgi:hypothetical protein